LTHAGYDLPMQSRIVIKVGDITQEKVDAIVNAANSSLMGGGGGDGAIHCAGGPAILEACKRIRETLPRGLPTGEAVITAGGHLPARFVIHTVGPIFGRHDGAEPRLLAACYENSIALAAQHALRTIAFPAISTGIYGYPKDEAAEVAIEAVHRALERHAIIEEVRLVYFSEEDARYART